MNAAGGRGKGVNRHNLIIRFLPEPDLVKLARAACLSPPRNRAWVATEPVGSGIPIRKTGGHWTLLALSTPLPPKNLANPPETPIPSPLSSAPLLPLHLTSPPHRRRFPALLSQGLLLGFLHATPHRRCHLPSSPALFFEPFSYLLSSVLLLQDLPKLAPRSLSPRSPESLTELENRYSYSVPVGAAAAAPASVVLRTRQGTTGRARGLTAAASLSLLSATRSCCCISAALFKEPVVFTAAIPSSSPFLPRLRPGLPSCSPRLASPPFPTLSLLFIPLPIRSAGARQEGIHPAVRSDRAPPPAASFPAGVRVAACMQGLVWLGFLGQGTCSSLLACALRLLAS